LDRHHSGSPRWSHMRFYLSQVFQHVYSKQEAVVTEIKDHGELSPNFGDGRAGQAAAVAG
jgi:hypothetical protein